MTPKFFAGYDPVDKTLKQVGPDKFVDEPRIEVKLESVEGFLKGELNLVDYYVHINPADPDDVDVRKKRIELTTKHIDQYLYALPKEDKHNKKYDIKVTNITKQNKLKIEMNSELKKWLASKNTLTAESKNFDNPDIIDIKGPQSLLFLISSNEDPHQLNTYKSIRVAELLTRDCVEIQYKNTEENKNIGVFTKRIYDDYILTEE